MVGQNALFFQNTNSEIMLNSYLISRFKYYIYRLDDLVSFNRKVYLKLDRTTS